MSPASGEATSNTKWFMSMESTLGIKVTGWGRETLILTRQKYAFACPVFDHLIMGLRLASLVLPLIIRQNSFRTNLASVFKIDDSFSHTAARCGNIDGVLGAPGERSDQKTQFNHGFNWPKHQMNDRFCRLGPTDRAKSATYDAGIGPEVSVTMWRRD